MKGETSDGKKLDAEIDSQQAQQMDEEALAILQRRAPLVPGEEGMRDIRVLRAVIAAAEQGAPVTL